jgi:hypothetical protein
MRQAAVWPLVDAMQFPASLLGCGWAELGACPAGYEFRGVLAPFRPERIAQPGQSYSHRHRHECLVLLRKQRSHGGQRGPNGKQAGRLARQDAGAERREAKQQAAEDIHDP